MKKYLLLFSLVFMLQTAFSQTDKPAFTSMDVFELEWVTNPQISPDGSKVVYGRKGMDIMKDRRTANLWMISADGTDHFKLTEQSVN